MTTSGQRRVPQTEVQGEETIHESLQSKQDQDLRSTIGDLAKSRKALLKVNDVLKHHLELDKDRSKLRSWTARALHAVLPQSWQENLPLGLTKFIAEEFDALELIERLMRNNVNNSQGALKKLAIAAIKTQQSLEQLEADLRTAERENWDAQQLQDYIANRAKIKVDPEIKTLLDKKFKGMSDQEKEQICQKLVQQLRARIELGNQLVRTIEKVCAAGLGVFQEGIGQYSSYMEVYKQIATIRDASRTFVELNESMYASRDALMATLKLSIQAMALAVEAARHVERYSIGSPEMHAALADGEKQLDAGLKALEEEQRTTIKSLKEKAEGKADGVPETGGVAPVPAK